MALQSRMSKFSKFSHGLAWTIFVLALVGWFVLRSELGIGAVCNLLIPVALAAQAWLLFLNAEKHQ